jgi:hypothetical protein
MGKSPERFPRRHESISTAARSARGLADYKHRRNIMTFEAILAIGMLIAFIFGMILGVSMSRPNIMR